MTFHDWWESLAKHLEPKLDESERQFRSRLATLAWDHSRMDAYESLKRTQIKESTHGQDVKE